MILSTFTGKSLSEALIFAEHGENTWLLTFRTIYVHKMFSPCSELGIFMYLTCDSINNLSSYFGLVEAKMRASDKDLPVIRP